MTAHAFRRDSISLSPDGAAAERGRLALAVTRTSYPRPGGTRAETADYRLVRITRLTRGGEVRAYREVASIGGGEQSHDRLVSYDGWGLLALIDVSMLDADRAVGIARAHTHGGHPDHPKAWESLDEAREALRPARKNGAA